MTSPRSNPRAFARSIIGTHAFDVQWLAHAVAAWLVVVMGTQIGIPAVDPRLEVTTRPMEILGVVVMTWTTSVHALPLVERSVWLTATSPRRLIGQRVVLFGAAAGAGCLLAWSVSGLIHGSGVPRSNVIGVWLLLFAIAAIGRVLIGPVAAFLAPAGLVGVFSSAVVLPFTWNPVFNTALETQLWTLALTLFLVGMALHATPRSRSRRHAPASPRRQ